MKKIEVFTKPYHLDVLTEALVELGIDGMTVSEVRGMRSEPRKTILGIGGDYVPQIKIELVVRDDQLREVLLAIHTSAAANSSKDVVMYVEPVDQSLRIRTGA